MRQTHDLKLAKNYFESVASGDKRFVVYRDDRGFQKGDRLLLRRFGKRGLSAGETFLKTDGDEFRASGQERADTIVTTITYVLTGGQLGIEPGYVVMGIDINEKE